MVPDTDRLLQQLKPQQLQLARMCVNAAVESVYDQLLILLVQLLLQRHLDFLAVVANRLKDFVAAAADVVVVPNYPSFF